MHRPHQRMTRESEVDEADLAHCRSVGVDDAPLENLVRLFPVRMGIDFKWRRKHAEVSGGICAPTHRCRNGFDVRDIRKSPGSQHGRSDARRVLSPRNLSEPGRYRCRKLLLRPAARDPDDRVERPGPGRECSVNVDDTEGLSIRP